MAIGNTLLFNFKLKQTNFALGLFYDFLTYTNRLCKNKFRNIQKLFAEVPYSCILPNGLKFHHRLCDRAVIYEIYKNRVYEIHPDFKIKKGFCVIDVGAHIGTFAINAAKLAGPSGKIIALEPLKVNQELFLRNCKENNLENVTLVKAAANNFDGEIGFCADEFCVGNICRESESKVKCLRLDNLMANFDINKVDILKIDVEGAELRVLEGALNLLKVTDKIVLETDSELLKKITKFLLNYGFKNIYNYESVAYFKKTV
jgi:FkbM family methyltransferase